MLLPHRQCPSTSHNGAKNGPLPINSQTFRLDFGFCDCFMHHFFFLDAFILQIQLKTSQDQIWTPLVMYGGWHPKILKNLHSCPIAAAQYPASTFCLNPRGSGFLHTF